MMTAALSQRARELAAAGTAFVTATVVRAQRPTSVKAGDVALVLGDGTIEGFVGGVCAQQSVRVYSLKSLQTEEAVLLRIVPDGPTGEDPATGREIEIEEGAVTAQNPCLSGGAIEIFLEPVLPIPRVLVVGDTPIAAAVLALGPELGLDLVPVERGLPIPWPAISRSSSRRTGETSSTRCARPWMPACRTSASSRATSAEPACSRSCGSTVFPTSSSSGSTCPPGSTSAPAHPPRSRSRSWRRSSPCAAESARPCRRRRASPLPRGPPTRPRRSSRSTRSAG